MCALMNVDITINKKIKDSIVELERLNVLLELLNNSAVKFFQAITLTELRKIVQMAIILKEKQLLDVHMHMVCNEKSDTKGQESWL